MKNSSHLMMAMAILFSVNLLAQPGDYLNNQPKAMQVAEYIGQKGITTDNAHQLYEKAYQHEVLGDYEEAIEFYSQTLMVDDLHHQARFNRARLCYELGRFALAESEFSDMLEQNNLDAEAFEMRGLSRFYNQKYGEAINDFNQAFRISGKEDILLHRGIALTKMGFYEDAFLDFDKLLKSSPNHAAAMAARGDVLLALRRYQPALHWFDKALNINETDAYTYCNRGIANMNLENYEAALYDFDRAIQLDANCRMFLNLAYCYFEMGEVELAKKYGILAMKDNPDNVEVYYLIGLAELESNMPDLAKESFGIALDADPENVAYLLGQAESYLLMEDYYAAIENCNTILDKDRNHADGTELLQRAFDGLEKFNLENLQTKPVVAEPKFEGEPQPQLEQYGTPQPALIPPVMPETVEENTFYEDPYGN
jgi:tetratricopeptide (TPR) repeat protein